MGGSCSCLIGRFKNSNPTSSTPLSTYGDTTIVSLGRPNSTHTIEEQIEHSKSHWSQVSKFELDVDEVAEVSNVKVFRTLQLHPEWGTFFVTFGKDGIGELVLGPKFAEGGQAELYDVKIQWNDPQMKKDDLQNGTEWVLKVFKKGTFLQQLQSQWPCEMLLNDMKRIEWFRHGNLPRTRVLSDVYQGTLLEDGRFAFLMVKEDEDLRHYIDRLMLTTRKNHCPFSKTRKNHCPFSKKDAISIMYRVALGVECLHNCGIIHRDLKASNVLRKHMDGDSSCEVADFECSIGVIGTGFFRAPEILQACKDRCSYDKPELFTKEADVYSYGMVCYEILTGKLPFDGYRENDFNHVLLGERPKLPNYVDGWLQDLLRMCWQANPSNRPSIRVILEILLDNSKDCREIYAYKEKLDMELGEGRTIPLSRMAMSSK